MKGIWQVAIAVCTVLLAASAAAASKDFGYDPPKVVRSQFDENLTMLDRERGEYATHLATHAANLVNTEGASKATLQDARRLLALSLHLAPRNRKALVVNSQLRRSIMPEKTEGAYSAGVLARLLLTRAELLRREGGMQNGLLSRCFVEMAADLDPRNEDAVYAFELQRIDYGDLDWKLITDPPVVVPVAPATEAAPETPASDGGKDAGSADKAAARPASEDRGRHGGAAERRR